MAKLTQNKTYNLKEYTRQLTGDIQIPEGIVPSNELVMVGCMLRMAEATEIGIDKLVAEVEYWKNRHDVKNYKVMEMQREIRQLKKQLSNKTSKKKCENIS